MSKKALIIDAGCEFYGQGGTLNHFFSEVIKEELEKLGISAEISKVEDDYVPHAEALKIKAADFVILQTPGWWMNVPWQCKKYLDYVLIDPEVCGGDGRSRHDAAKKYGTGGRCQGFFMLSSTWNAPLKAFTGEDEFFEGAGMDAALFCMIKPFEFVGLKRLPSFMANDVLKNPDIAGDTARLRQHIAKVFGPLI